MKKILPKILFFYSAIASVFITISLVLTSNTIAPVIFATLFLPITAYFVIEFFKELRGAISQKNPIEKLPKAQTGNVIPLVIFFLILTGIGIRNVYVAKSKLQDFVPEVSTTTTNTLPAPSSIPEATPASTLKISITDGSASINIRQKPTIYSEKIGVAIDGDTFSYTEVTAGWYKINLATGSGYISAKYVAK